MPRLIRSASILSLVLAAAFAAPAAHAQRHAAVPDAPRVAPSAASAPAMAAPLPRELAPPSIARSARRVGEGRVPALAGEARRSGWKYPLIGALAGAVVGAGVGTYVMLQSDEWLAPPAYIVTVPAGAVLGLAIGGIANLVAPR